MTDSEEMYLSLVVSNLTVLGNAFSQTEMEWGVHVMILNSVLWSENTVLLSLSLAASNPQAAILIKT